MTPSPTRTRRRKPDVPTFEEPIRDRHQVKTSVRDCLIPAGYEVTLYEPFMAEPWYEAQEGSRKLGHFARRDDAIEACQEDVKTRGWRRTSRYDMIAADDEPKPTRPGCGQCGKTINPADNSPVEWLCVVCDKRVCRDCLLTIPGSCPTEYFAETLCSRLCWEKAGRPAE